jgi:type IV pilus assembly protein PilW
MKTMRRIIKSGQSPRSRRARGLSLIELLVAMVISLIAITAIFQVYSVFEEQKRTTMGGGEAQTNGALALFTLERELRQAGYGVNSTDYLGCNTLGWDDLTGTAFTLTFTPVQITQGAGEAPDTLTVLYGNGNLIPQAVNLIQTMADDTVPYRVANRFGFQEGDVVIVAETGLNCTVGQATNLPAPLGQQDLIVHSTGNYTDPVTGANLPARYNKGGGLGVTYTFNGRVFNLGPRPSYNVYTVQNAQLALQQMLSAPSTAVTTIYDGIVQLQAQYGRDTNADGIIDVFDEFVPATAADWATILAVRIGVVARSGLYEKTEVSPATIKLWDDSAVAPTTVGPVWTLTADERHYRYKVFRTVVPIRNMIWRP